jgi:hypothetical protein
MVRGMDELRAARPVPPLYGPRDAVSVLMGRGYRVARRWIGYAQGRRWYWTIAPPPAGGKRPAPRRVTLAGLEDEAEQYERLRYRHTPRGRCHGR